MLYDLHELQRAFLAPLAAFTSTGSQLFSNPYSPLAYTPLSRQFAAAYELANRLGKDYQKPAWNLPTTTIDGRETAVFEDTALAQPFCRLVHFRRDTRRRDPVVLVVAPLSGHHATLLRDTVRTLLPDHDVYVTDWR
ncbi:MAG TPA: polyhydroxyalkanoate depolymerase, partial [Castellaniella sp.]|nr:polyhydroxyalkanoate depolymerase [Castellaniella sp.]